MKKELLFETFEDFCNRAEEILKAFKQVVLLPSFSFSKYKNYIYNEHKFSDSETLDLLAKDKCWIWLMSYKYEKVNINDLYCTLGTIKKAQLKKQAKYDTM